MIRDTIYASPSLNAPPRGAGSPTPTFWPQWLLLYASVCCAALISLWFYRAQLFIGAPVALLLPVMLSMSLSFACGGQAYVHKRFSRHDFVGHNEVGGFIIAVTGTLYAVLLGFLTVVAWQHFADARQFVAQESAAATDVWHTAIGIPNPERTRLRDDVMGYAQSMVRSEWPKMRSGAFDSQADFLIMDAITAAGTFNPANLMESNSQAATLAQLNVLHDIRARRLAENAGGIAAFEWLVLLIGVVCIITFCWLFGLANQRIHLLMTATVTIVSTTLLLLLFELQYPFRTDLGIQPESWEAAINHIHLMVQGSQMFMR